jgi:hypothetical protein
LTPGPARVVLSIDSVPLRCRAVRPLLLMDHILLAVLSFHFDYSSDRAVDEVGSRVAAVRRCIKSHLTALYVYVVVCSHPSREYTRMLPVFRVAGT